MLQADSCLNWSDDLIKHYTNKNVSVGVQVEEECNLEHLYAFTRYVTLTALAGTGWFLRMSIDPFIDIVSFFE